jgi:hypothetical protein
MHPGVILLSRRRGKAILTALKKQNYPQFSGLRLCK